jgi:hypothetical protein
MTNYNVVFRFPFDEDESASLNYQNLCLREIVEDALPELKLRLKGFEQCWPGEEINAEVKRLTKLIIRAEHALSVP